MLVYKAVQVMYGRRVPLLLHKIPLEYKIGSWAVPPVGRLLAFERYRWGRFDSLHHALDWTYNTRRGWSIPKAELWLAEAEDVQACLEVLRVHAISREHEHSLWEAVRRFWSKTGLSTCTVAPPSYTVSVGRVRLIHRIKEFLPKDESIFQ